MEVADDIFIVAVTGGTAGDANGRCFLRRLFELNGLPVVMELVQDFIQAAIGAAGETGIFENGR